VHGLTRNARDFDKVAEKLVLANHNFRVVSVDMPGRGYSDWLKSPTEYNYLQYCADLTTLLASLGFESCYWIGTSMGGLIGMTMASAENSPIKKMFLNDIGPFISAHSLGKIASYVGSNPTFKDRKEAEAYFKSIHSGFGVAEHEWDHFVHHSTRPVDDTSSFRLHYDPAIAAPFKVGSTQDVAMWALWEKIKCPVFLMRGAKSEVLGSETVEEMKKKGPGLAKFVELSQYGHAPHLFTDVTVDPIVEFLTQN
jgi:pimeloyl-ACP methyl ester carboxylesterase